jgi:Cofilin/tropomyosin-type actin-binding protein
MAATWLEAVNRCVSNEEFQWVLMTGNFRSKELTMECAGLDGDGFAHLVARLPDDEIRFAFVRFEDLSRDPFLVQWMPPSAPIMHSGHADGVKEHFWYALLEDGCMVQSLTKCFSDKASVLRDLEPELYERRREEEEERRRNECDESDQDVAFEDILGALDQVGNVDGAVEATLASATAQPVGDENQSDDDDVDNDVDDDADDDDDDDDAKRKNSPRHEETQSGESWAQQRQEPKKQCCAIL